MKVAAPVMSVTTSVSIALPEPREVQNFKGDTITVTFVEWARRVTENYDLTTTVLYADDFNNTSLYGYIPSWVPRPPDGWDAGVVAVCKSAAVSA